MAKTFEEYKVDAHKQTAESRKKDLGSIDSSADAAIKLAEDTYKTAEANTIVDYASDYERNAVQKLINEKKIAERSANLGLTDSGLNRTQQTAVQLSYANQKGKLDIAKQQALDKLSSDLASYVTGINNQREADKLSVNQFYDQQNNTIATELYNTDVEDARKRWETEYNAGIELQKAAIEAESDNEFLLWRPTGTYDDDDNQIFVNSEGKTQAFGAGVNPYTGTKHKDAKYGTFSNGYQPNHIGVTTIDEKGKKVVEPKKLYSQTEYEVYVNGKKQKVWSYDKGKTLWAWDGSINDYVDVTSQRDELKKKANGGD